MVTNKIGGIIVIKEPRQRLLLNRSRGSTMTAILY